MANSGTWGDPWAHPRRSLGVVLASNSIRWREAGDFPISSTLAMSRWKWMPTDAEPVRIYYIYFIHTYAAICMTSRSLHEVPKQRVEGDLARGNTHDIWKQNIENDLDWQMPVEVLSLFRLWEATRAGKLWKPSNVPWELLLMDNILH